MFKNYGMALPLLVVAIVVVVLLNRCAPANAADYREGIIESSFGNTAYVILNPGPGSDPYKVAERVCDSQGGQYAQKTNAGNIEVLCKNDTTMSYFVITR